MSSVVIPESGEAFTPDDVFVLLANTSVRLQRIDMANSLLIYADEAGEHTVTFQMNLLDERQRQQLGDFLSLLGLQLGDSFRNAYNPVAVILERVGGSLVDVADALVGLPATETLAEKLQRNTDYVYDLLRRAPNTIDPPFDTSHLSALLETEDRERKWKEAVESLVDAPNSHKKAVMRLLYGFFRESRTSEWRSKLQTLVLDKMRRRLLLNDEDADPSYLEYLYESPTLIGERIRFEDESERASEALLRWTARTLELDESLANYFDPSHRDYHVPYPDAQRITLPAHRTIYEYATTEDTGRIEVHHELYSTSYHYVAPHTTVDSSYLGHQLVDKLVFAQNVVVSVANLSIGMVGTALNTVVPFRQREFKGFLDIHSPPYLAILRFVVEGSLVDSPNPLYRALAESDDLEQIRTLAKEEAHAALLEHVSFVRLLDELSLSYSVYVPETTVEYTKTNVSRKYDGPALIEGRYLAVFSNRMLASDVETYLEYMGDLARRLMEKEEGFLAQFTQVLKTVEVSLEMLLSTVFTTGKVGLKWLTPLLSVPLLAASPFVLAVKYMVDTVLFNYASSKTFVWIALELLVLPLELLARTVASYGGILAESLHLLLESVRERVRIAWNDVAKEVVAYLVRLDKGAPTQENFLFRAHTWNGAPQYGGRTYHLDLEASTALILSHIYHGRYEAERDEHKAQLAAQLATLNEVLGEKRVEIKEFLSTNYEEVDSSEANEAYLGETIQLHATVRPSESNSLPWTPPPHEAFLRRYPYGTLALYPVRSELEKSVENHLPTGVELRPFEFVEAVHYVNVQMGSSTTAEYVRDIVFGPNEIQQYDSFVTESTNVSLRMPVTDLFVSEIVEAMENVLRL